LNNSCYNINKHNQKEKNTMDENDNKIIEQKRLYTIKEAAFVRLFCCRFSPWYFSPYGYVY